MTTPNASLTHAGLLRGHVTRRRSLWRGLTK